MFEKDLTRRERLVRALRDGFCLDRCIAMTTGQRMWRAAVWLVLGEALGIAAAVHYVRTYPAPVNVLQPVVEHAGERLSVIRFSFEHRNGVASCRVVIHHNDEHTWSVQC